MGPWGLGFPVYLLWDPPLRDGLATLHLHASPDGQQPTRSPRPSPALLASSVLTPVPGLSSPFTLLSLEGSRLLCLFFRLRPAGPAGSSTWHCSSPDLLPFIAVARMLSQAPSLLPWLGAPALSSFCLCFYCPLRPLPSLFSKVCQTALSFLLSAPSDLSLPLSCQIQDLSQLLLAYHVENHIHTILIISLRSSYIGTIIFFHMYM